MWGSSGFLCSPTQTRPPLPANKFFRFWRSFSTQFSWDFNHRCGNMWISICPSCLWHSYARRRGLKSLSCKVWLDLERIKKDSFFSSLVRRQRCLLRRNLGNNWFFGQLWFIHRCTGENRQSIRRSLLFTRGHWFLPGEVVPGGEVGSADRSRGRT